MYFSYEDRRNRVFLLREDGNDVILDWLGGLDWPSWLLDLLVVMWQRILQKS